MTLYLEEIDVVPELADCRSALIVVCRFCPATSLALQEGRPYIELFRHRLDTAAFEEYIADLRRRLEDVGLETEVLRGGLLNFIICMWTRRQRRRLRRAAGRYEAAVVLGCDVAFETIRDLLADTDCRVVHGMSCAGVLDAVPRFSPPGTVTLEMVRVTPLEQHEEAS